MIMEEMKLDSAIDWNGEMRDGKVVVDECERRTRNDDVEWLSSSRLSKIAIPSSRVIDRFDERDRAVKIFASFTALVKS